MPIGAAPAMVAVMPSSRACLTIRPASTSSVPTNSTSGVFCRMEVSAALKSFWSVVTTWSSTGLTPRSASALVKASCSPLPKEPLLLISAIFFLPWSSTRYLASVSS